MVSYLVALDPSFSFSLFFEWFSVSLSFVYLETMFGSHGPLLARHIGPLLVFYVKGELSILEYFLVFFPNSPMLQFGNCGKSYKLDTSNFAQSVRVGKSG